MRRLKAKLNQTTLRIVAVLIFALASAVAVGARFYLEPGAAISQTNEAAVIKVIAVGREDLYDTASQGNLNFHVKVRGSCDTGWRVGSATVTVKGKVHHLNVKKDLESIGFDNGEKWSFQVVTFPYLTPDTKSSPVAMCNAELERRLARGDSKAQVLSKGFDLTAPHGYDAKLSVACLRKKNGFLESYHPSAYTKLPVTISCQPTDYKPEPTPGAPKSTPGTPQRTPGTPQRTPGTPQRTPGAPQRTPGAPKRTPSLPGRLPMPEPESVANESLPNPQLEFVGQEPYEVNGAKGTRYKLGVTNHASIPDSLWQQSPNLPACGKNENAARTWVEIFGSPGNKRLYGFCGVRSSEDLAQLWFPMPAGERGPQCVYVVMTDRQTGKKYISNRVCSRSFTVVTGSLKGGGQQEAPAEDRSKDRMGNFEIQRLMSQYNENQPGTFQGNRPETSLNQGPSPLEQAASEAANNKAVQPDLSIRQFLFPPTNDKALRVRVVNTGQGASAACRLVLTVRKINGVAAGRTTYVNVPALAPGAADWLHIDARSILPNNVSLQSTTFRLNVDATEIVAESNESNNEVWHNQ
ncbi:MAG TPA: CARDB domain-containing protein [Pyrinomonadaceae bacterium]|nr:CARDB domain-containing protein [Pyrinomonadaceae bacterium]